MDRNSKIYIAGHRGLVGSSLLRKLKQSGYNNLILKTSKELDLRNQLETENFFKEAKPEYVFLAAAKVGGILANSTYKAEFIYDNLAIAVNIIHSSYKYSVKKLLNLGSACIYPKHSSQPMKEEYLLSGKLEPTNESYSIAKITAIKMCRYYNEQYNTNFMSLMPANLFGPNDNLNLETAHVLPSLIRKFYLAKFLKDEKYEAIKNDISKYKLGFELDSKVNLDDKNSIIEVLKGIGVKADTIKLWGSGEPYREFLYVDDLADACLFIMKNHKFEDIGEFINVGAGEDSKIKELAELVKTIVGFKGQILWDNSKPDGMPKKLLDVSRMKNMGWESKVGITKGIESTYKWAIGEEALQEA